MALSRATERLLSYAAILLLIAAMVWGGDMLDHFRLDAHDTVDDYRQAKTDDAVGFRMRICHDGECLTPRDWACGFENGDEVAFDACFDQLIGTAKPWVELDHIRKFCGVTMMRFTATYGDTIRCRKVGGQWGVPSIPPDIGFRDSDR